MGRPFNQGHLTYLAVVEDRGEPSSSTLPRTMVGSRPITSTWRVCLNVEAAPLHSAHQRLAEGARPIGLDRGLLTFAVLADTIERSFVLAPRCELAPEQVLRGRSARAWLAARPVEVTAFVPSTRSSPPAGRSGFPSRPPQVVRFHARSGPGGQPWDVARKRMVPLAGGGLGAIGAVALVGLTPFAGVADCAPYVVPLHLELQAVLVNGETVDLPAPGVSRGAVLARSRCDRRSRRGDRRRGVRARERRRDRAGDLANRRRGVMGKIGCYTG